MTAEQLALETLNVQQYQAWITGAAIIIGPLIAVALTLWTQGRKERRDAQMNLFTLLLAHRKFDLPPHASAALNTIDVVFANEEKVLTLWRQYFVCLQQPVPTTEQALLWLKLLESMGATLGYPNLDTLALDRFYRPRGHVDQWAFQQRVNTHLERVLANTERFLVEPKADHVTGQPLAPEAGAQHPQRPQGTPQDTEAPR